MRRILITSALPYINGIKHLGNLVGSMLPADVAARFFRLRGNTVLFVCGTDEHGTPAELSAQRADLAVEEYCRQQHARQAQLGAGFELSWDHFGRSSSSQNRQLTQYFARKLEENGLIAERATAQTYSASDQRFLPDRYVIGTCPHCGYQGARGDQCENCTRLLDPEDLIQPRSAISGSTQLEVRTTTHLFLRQSLLQDEIGAWVSTHRADWPPLVSSIARKWLTEGLNDRSITRDLEWGVPVDRPGFEGKVYYVWFDAPIAYIGATKEWADLSPNERDWKSWWYEADDVRYIQFMAKDNIPFHTVSFPCTIIGSQEPWKLVDYIKGFHWLTYYGTKFSTSAGRGIFMDTALEILPSDYWRFALLANAPESGDADFSWELFSATINGTLVSSFGNYIRRCLSFSYKTCGGRVPEPCAVADETYARLIRDGQKILDNYTQFLEALEFRKAMRELTSLWRVANRYWEHAAPWQHVETAPEECREIARVGLNLAKLLAVLSSPVIPSAARVVLEAFREAEPSRWPVAIEEEMRSLHSGCEFSVPNILFQPITPENIERWRQEFGF